MNQTASSTKWLPIPAPDAGLQHAINQQLRILGEEELHPLVMKHVASLGISEIPEILKFLSPKKENCHSPWLMKGIHEAMPILEDAIIRGLHITIVGDYDVDGVGSTKIAYKSLKKLGAKVDYYIPHRKHEGYGIKSTVVERLKQRGTEVILTVDNGIAAVNAIALAKSYGMTVVLTDHHTPPEILPEADVIINPHQPGCLYPFKKICGGAVAYKLFQAMFEYMGLEPTEIEEFEETLALCTVADVMPLIDENRVFVIQGLQKMRKKPSPGIAALLKCLGIDPKKQLNETSIGFYIGPCLNAPGRLDSAEIALQLLLTETSLEAAVVANTCFVYNGQRQGLVEKALQEAQPLLRPNDGLQVLCLDAEEGIAGVIAGNVKESMKQPTFVFTPAHSDTGQTILKGSARSIPGFSLFECLLTIAKVHPDWFVTWGGHAMAAGVSIFPQYLDDFRTAANEVMKSTPVAAAEFYYLDEVSENELNRLSHQFEKLAPYGQGHPKPSLKLVTTLMDTQVFGPKKNHLRIFSKEGSELTLFRGADFPVQAGQEASVFVTVGRSFFAGREKLDLLVNDIEQ